MTTKTGESNPRRRKASAGPRSGSRRSEAPEPGQLVRRALRDLHDGVEGSLDPLGMSAPIVHAQLAWLAHPQELAERFARLSSDLWTLQMHSVNRLFGLQSADPVTPNPDDARFADPIWTEGPTWDLTKEWYLALTHHTQDDAVRHPRVVRQGAATGLERLPARAQTKNVERTSHVRVRLAINVPAMSAGLGAPYRSLKLTPG